MKKRMLSAFGVFLNVSVVLAATPAEPPKSRGQLLIENHCTRCHESAVYTRNPNKVTKLDDLYHWVEKWATLQHLDWHQDEIRDAVDYLNQEYYHLKK